MDELHAGVVDDLVISLDSGNPLQLRLALRNMPPYIISLERMLAS